MACNCYKYASDYRRMCDLAQRLANVEKTTYVVYQLPDTSYNFIAEHVGTQHPILFRALPNE